MTATLLTDPYETPSLPPLSNRELASVVSTEHVYRYLWRSKSNTANQPLRAASCHVRVHVTRQVFAIVSDTLRTRSS